MVGAKEQAVHAMLKILLWPFVAACRLGLPILIRFRPEIAQGRRAFPGGVRRVIEQATAVEVHYAELGSDEPGRPGQLGRPIGFSVPSLSERPACRRSLTFWGSGSLLLGLPFAAPWVYGLFRLLTQS